MKRDYIVNCCKHVEPKLKPGDCFAVHQGELMEVFCESCEELLRTEQATEEQLLTPVLVTHDEAFTIPEGVPIDADMAVYRLTPAA